MTVRSRKRIGYYLITGNKAVQQARVNLVRNGGDLLQINDLVEIALHLLNETASTPEGATRIMELKSRLIPAEPTETE